MNLQNVSNQVPLMERKQFSEITGISPDSLNKMIQNGYVPVIRLKNDKGNTKRSFVNLVALRDTCLNEVSPDA